MTKNLLQSSLLDAACGIVFQVFCRFVTFGINAFIVRNVGREVLGIMNVRLLLLESTLLFLSKEAIVRAALSATTQQRDKCSWSQLINQMWLSVVACLVLCVPCLHVWIHWLSPVNAAYVQQYELGCYAVALSCIIELCAEPAVFLVQVFCFIKLKIIFQTLHILIRSIIFLWIVLGDNSLAINAFATAQLASAITIFCSHYIFFYFYTRRLKDYRAKQIADDDDEDKYNKHKNYIKMDDFPLTTITEFLPGQLTNNERFFNTELQVLTVSFVRQSILKQILTEGEKYVMSVSPVLSFSEQATYDVVNNLGSLAARFIFRPIEESSYFYFTQTLSRDISLEKQPLQKVEEAGDVLSKVSLVVTSIALLVLTFGYNYAYTALYLYGAVFPELPKIGVCHQYDIEYKYTYKCTLCAAKSYAHTKSKKVENIRCAFCHGAIEVFLNKKDKDGNVMPTPVREAKGFAKFVKDRYKQYKKPDLKHADVMKILSNEFAALKVNGENT